ncbi:hypothetical protein C8R42DRAFT_647541 [Lentinula raphanica]|nr:hypothetical protein C8R42DRAFT_647541 [Lentinula raphanica]
MVSFKYNILTILLATTNIASMLSIPVSVLSLDGVRVVSGSERLRPRTDAPGNADGGKGPTISLPIRNKGPGEAQTPDNQKQTMMVSATRTNPGPLDLAERGSKLMSFWDRPRFDSGIAKLSSLSPSSREMVEQFMKRDPPRNQQDELKDILIDLKRNPTDPWRDQRIGLFIDRCVQSSSDMGVTLEKRRPGCLKKDEQSGMARQPKRIGRLSACVQQKRPQRPSRKFVKLLVCAEVGSEEEIYHEKVDSSNERDATVRGEAMVLWLAAETDSRSTLGLGDVIPPRTRKMKVTLRWWRWKECEEPEEEKRRGRDSGVEFRHIIYSACDAVVGEAEACWMRPANEVLEAEEGRRVVADEDEYGRAWWRGGGSKSGAEVDYVNAFMFSRKYLELMKCCQGVIADTGRDDGSRNEYEMRKSGGNAKRLTSSPTDGMNLASSRPCSQDRKRLNVKPSEEEYARNQNIDEGQDGSWPSLLLNMLQNSSLSATDSLRTSPV